MTTSQRTIAFGDDHSPGAGIAWQWCIHQQWAGWRVRVLTAAGRPEVAGEDHSCHPWQPPSPRTAPAECGLAPVLHETAAADPRALLGTGSPGDLIVVGGRGRGLLKALHVGSTAEWLMRCPNAPLVIARQPERVTRVILCTDGSRHADSALGTLLLLPWLASCHVTVLQAVEGPRRHGDSARAAADALAAVGCTVEVVVLEPDPTYLTHNVRTMLETEIAARSPDLVALGTAGLGGRKRLQLGSVASDVAHHTTHTVLLSRAPEPAAG